MLTTEHFTIDLPVGWHERPAAANFEFWSEKGDEQIIIAVARVADAPDKPSVEKTADDLFEFQKRAFAEMSKGAAMIAPSLRRTDVSGCTIEYVGADPINSVLVFGRIVVSSAKAARLTYLRYGSLADPPSFTTKAEAVARSLRFR